jgi:adenosine deaminase
MQSIVDGISRGLADAEATLGVTSGLILCFLRHLPERDALDTLDAALPFRDQLCGIGLDSAEVGHPPEKFVNVFQRARDEGLHVVAHAGEEGPPDYIWQALDLLGAERIDHGVRSLEDATLVRRLAEEAVPLTVCPLSNIKLRVFDKITDHPLLRLVGAGVTATVNSDDPAYFGGYVGDNFAAVGEGLHADHATLEGFARNSFTASFLDDPTKERHLATLDAWLASAQ